jgi:hypothetical protein
MLPWPPSLLNATVTSALPQRGHHQGGTPVSIFGSNLLFNTSSQAGIRCCWDHHPGFLGSQTIDGSLVVGGDGVTDEETDATLVSDELVVCPSYSSVPGYTHTDDLLLAFGPSCASSPLLDTGLDFQFYLSTQDMQLVAATPRGGPVAGGTRVRLMGDDRGGAGWVDAADRGGGFGGRAIRCRFGWYEVAATYVDLRTLLCDSPAVAAPHTAELQVSADGEAWSLPLRYSFYSPSHHVSSVWPRGGPAAGGTPLTVRGAGFADYDGLAVRIGSGAPMRAWLLSSSALVAISANASSDAATGAAGGTRIALPGGGFDDGGLGVAAAGGEPVRVSLNGGLREAEDLLRGDTHVGAVRFRYYQPKLLVVSGLVDSARPV